MYMGIRHQEGLAHLLYGINQGGGFVVLTGEVGTGKTTLCHCLLQQLPSDIDLALILNPRLNATELLAAICDELGVHYDKQEPKLKTLIDLLNQRLLAVHANGRRTVLLIDEAQNLSLEVLEQIRLLTNLETTKTKLLQIILVGQPELKQMLTRQDLRQLNQRITARYHLLPLSLAETRAYIRHRLTLCNGKPNLFNAAAIRRVYKFSNGIPRLINIICDRSLLGAYSHEKQLISPGIVNQAVKESIIKTEQAGPAMSTVLALLLLGCLTAVYFLWFYPSTKSIKLTTQLSQKIQPVTNKQVPDKVPQKTVISLTPVEKLPAKPKVDFSGWVSSSSLTLETALVELLKLWANESPLESANCQDIQKTRGLNCLPGKVSWKELLAMNRPVILEFLLTSGEKRYAVMAGFRKSQAMVQFQANQEFPLADILQYWNGYYLALWKYPRPEMRVIYPQQSSDDVLWLRQQLDLVSGAKEDSNTPRLFDEKLKRRVLEFQHKNHLQEDGIAGAQTIIYLDNISGSADSPHLKIVD
jgi:general secretion pathway protein A